MRKQKAQRERLGLILALGVLLLIALVFISRLSRFQISEVVVSGATVTGEDVVRQKVNETLLGHYFWLVPHSNALLYKKGAMREELRERFPRFSSVAISTEGLSTLVVEVVEREPFALYCSQADLCWFLDEAGFVFDQAPIFSEGVYFSYTQEPPLTEPMGQFLIPTEEFRELSAFIAALRTLALDPIALKIGETDRILSLSNDSRILWQKETDLNRTINNLSVFLNSPTIKAQKDFLEKVSELDLRTEDKVFYRFHE